ncbi:unnamed protein product [Ostreobium quekettii]|uniref:50S ribosomal protein L18 n=1 Tax=Ostreobium quekettii TaxID=121088 RepID=A0A8S1IYU5_9CHLO|nr:unnamed protein product [Ostreobium quekettii]|eukprot:evm.model.scf_330.9 EVM.evm.TU.scf_330.9   scf_330:70989-71306(+)
MVPKPTPYHLKLFMSNKYTYAQVLRVLDGHIVASASTHERSTRAALEGQPKADKAASALVGRLIAERARALGIAAVHFKLAEGKKYHGKIKELVEAMKANGVGLC